MTRVAIVASMAGELKPFVRGWRRQRSGGVDMWRWLFDEGQWIAACAGTGAEAAARAFVEVEKGGDISFVISTGWAGALSEEFAVGRAYSVSGVVEVRSGERFRTAISGEERWLATSPRVADETEKRRLAAAYGAGLVDMEAAAVARLAAMRGIPFYCIKGVSDGSSDRLPDFNRFLSGTGEFRLGRFVVFALARPWLWPGLMRMGENSRKAAESIAESLLDFLDERGRIRRRNGYPNLKG